MTDREKLIKELKNTRTVIQDTYNLLIETYDDFDMMDIEFPHDLRTEIGKELDKLDSLTKFTKFTKELKGMNWEEFLTDQRNKND